MKRDALIQALYTYSTLRLEPVISVYTDPKTKWQTAISVETACEAALNYIESLEKELAEKELLRD